LAAVAVGLAAIQVTVEAAVGITSTPILFRALVGAAAAVNRLYRLGKVVAVSD